MLMIDKYNNPLSKYFELRCVYSPHQKVFVFVSPIKTVALNFIL